MVDKIPAAAGNGSMLIKPATWEALRQRVEELEIIPDPEEFEITRRRGKLFFRRKVRPTDDSGTGGGGSAAGTCPFGEITTNSEDPPESSIRGGLIICGDKNFHVADRAITSTGDSDHLVQIKLTGVTPATDDDVEIFLPGVTTATGTPAWETKTVEEGYSDNSNPASPGATGDIIFPIGRLKVTDGVIQFIPLGCGNLTVGQCAGILNFSRA